MTSNAIRVLVLTSLFPARPGEKQGNFVLDQVRELVAHGAEVTVLVGRPWVPAALRRLSSSAKSPIDPSNYASEPFRIANVRFFSLPRFALGTFACHFIRRILPSIREIHASWGFDVIHAHGFLLGYAAVAASKELKVPAVLTVHGIETSPRFDNTPAKRMQIGGMLQACDRVVLVGSPLLEYVRRYTTRLDNCTIVENGSTLYSDLSPSRRLLRNRPVRLVAVSNYEPSKGFEILIRALASLDIRSREQVEVVLIGAGEGFRDVVRLTDQLGISGQVHYLGPLLHRDTMAEILAANVFCLPSWREAFGIMYAEAMSLGKFTMGCDGQGPADFIRHRKTGYLMAPRSVTAVAEGLRWAVLHPDERGVIAAAGQEFALRNLTWSQNAARILAVYRESITSRAKFGN